MNEQAYKNRITELESEIAALKGGRKISITQIGVHTPRDLAGNLATDKSIKIYALTADLQSAEIMPPHQDDGKEYVDVAGLFCQKQKAYIEAVKAAERENIRRPRTIPPTAETPESIDDAEMAAAETRALSRIRAALVGVGLPTSNQ